MRLMPIVPFVLCAWGWNPWEDLESENKELKLENPHPGGPTMLFMRFYSKYIGPIDGPNCTFRPSCGAYCMKAIRKHGWLLGWIMGCERAMRYHRNYHLYPRTFDGDRVYMYDPVQENDFWFSSPFSTSAYWVGGQPHK